MFRKHSHSKRFSFHEGRLEKIKTASEINLKRLIFSNKLFIYTLSLLHCQSPKRKLLLLRWYI